jgi:hypothetical protein
MCDFSIVWRPSVGKEVVLLIYTVIVLHPHFQSIRIYLEYHSVCPLVRIGTPSTPSLTSECVPRNQRGDRLAAGEGVWGGVPISDD